MRALLFRFVIASIVVNAAAGIVVLLTGDLGEREGKVLLTTLSVSAAALVSLPPMAVVESGRDPRAALAAIAATVIGFAMIIGGIWAEPEDGYWRVAGSFVTFGLALALGSLLSLPRLTGMAISIRSAAYLFMAVMAAQVLYGIWTDRVEDSGARLLGITGILLAASCLLVPIVQRAQRPASPVAAGDGLRFCPRCGAEARYDGAMTTCSRCGGSFSVQPAA